MTYFATVYTYDDRDDMRTEVRPDHRAYLAELTAQGSLAVSGPYEGGARGALLIFSAESEDAARAIVAQDPFVLHGLVASHTVMEWKPVSGALAEHF